VAFLINWQALATWLFSDASLDFLACQFFSLMLILLIGYKQQGGVYHVVIAVQNG